MLRDAGESDGEVGTIKSSFGCTWFEQRGPPWRELCSGTGVSDGDVADRGIAVAAVAHCCSSELKASSPVGGRSSCDCDRLQDKRRRLGQCDRGRRREGRYLRHGQGRRTRPGLLYLGIRRLLAGSRVLRQHFARSW